MECDAAVDVPRFTYVGKDEFENPWHLASWVPTDPQVEACLLASRRTDIPRTRYKPEEIVAKLRPLALYDLGG